MRAFFSLAHATSADHGWPGVYFHGHLESEVRARLSLYRVQGAPDLVASRDPLISRVLGPANAHGARPVIARASHVPIQSGTPCDVYGLLCALYLWRDPLDAVHGLICLDRDNEARDYAFRKFQARADFLWPSTLRSLRHAAEIRRPEALRRRP